MEIKLSAEALHIINKLNECSYQCYAVGGCIRDILMNKKPYDYDFTTDATPDQINECFKDYMTYTAGKKYGTVCVLHKKQKFEITTFRSDGKYDDNRHPSSVEFTKDIKEDLKRRDFTINALAYNEKDGLIDIFSSADDIKKHIIRCVGYPNRRFNEDALRILRALRFSSQLDFDIEKLTSGAVHDNRALLKNVASERISSEFVQILTGKRAASVLREYRDVFAVFLPEIQVMFDYDQKSLHHSYDLWEHTVRTIDYVENDPVLRIAMLFHDIGKAHTQSIDMSGHAHYRGHPSVSVYITRPILKRLSLPNTLIKEILTLIEYHDIRLNGNKVLIKETLRRIGPELTKKLMKIQMADLMSQSEYKRDIKLSNLKRTQCELDSILMSDQCYSLAQLKINGNDLIDAGVKDGKLIGQLLDVTLTAVINGTVKNSRRYLIRYAVSQKKYLTKR